jgi:hypothetical protein
MDLTVYLQSPHQNSANQIIMILSGWGILVWWQAFDLQTNINTKIKTSKKKSLQFICNSYLVAALINFNHAKAASIEDKVYKEQRDRRNERHHAVSKLIESL